MYLVMFPGILRRISMLMTPRSCFWRICVESREVCSNSRSLSQGCLSTRSVASIIEAPPSATPKALFILHWLGNGASQSCASSSMRGRTLVCAFEWCNCAAILRIREEAMRDVGENDSECHLRMPYSEHTVIGRAFAAPNSSQIGNWRGASEK
jgi:hypothetical protein